MLRWVLLLLAGLAWRLAPGRDADPTPAPPVRAAARPAGTVPVFFLNGAELHPVYRPAGPATVEHALRLLLAGPGAPDRAVGLRTALPRGARLLRVVREPDETIVDVSDVGAPAAVPEAAAQIAATVSSFPGIRAVRVCEQGRPVRAVLRAQFLHPTPFFSMRPASLSPISAPGAPAQASMAGTWPYSGLAGKVIVLSPGHGLTRFSNGQWRFQRPEFGGVVEDRLNVQFAIEAARALRALGATVYGTRALEMADEGGVSGAPRWQEAAKYYLRDTGAPDWVYQPLPTDFEADIDSRPLYANYRGADLLISIHNNIGAGSGTLTLYDTGNGYGGESRRLARLLHDGIVRAVRARVSPGWRANGARGTDARYGENHWAHMPSAIVEVGFYNRRWDRTRLVRSDFQAAVGEAIAAAVAEYFGVEPAMTPQNVAAVPNEPVVAPRPASPPVVVCLGDPGGSLAAHWMRHLQARARAQGVAAPRVVRPAEPVRTVEEALALWQRRVAPLRPSFVLIAFGRHELARDGRQHGRVPVERFEEALTEAVRRTRALGAIPVLATLSPIDSRRYHAAGWPGRGAHAGDRVQDVRDAYNAAIRRVARRTVTPLADVSLAAWRHERQWIAPVDEAGAAGSTLTPAAQQRVAELFSDAMARTFGPWSPRPRH